MCSISSVAVKFIVHSSYSHFTLEFCYTISTYRVSAVICNLNSVTEKKKNKPYIHTELLKFLS